MRVRIPTPISGGLILSYRCTASCRHCMYACSPRWPDDWMSSEDLETTLQSLAGRIQPSPGGAEMMSLNPRSSNPRSSTISLRRGDSPGIAACHL